MTFGSVQRFIDVTRDDGLSTAVTRTKAFLEIQATTLEQTYFRRPIGEPRVRTEILGSQMDLDISSSQVARQLAANGIKEPGSVTAYRDLLAALRDNNEIVHIFDVGANIGYFTLIAANVLGSTGQIYAFEPGPNNIRQLKQNIELNNYSQIDIEQIAIGAEQSTMELQLIGDSDIHQMVEVNPSTDGETIEVDVRTLDEFVDSQAVPADEPIVIKMDIEGYEGAAFEGMTDLLESDRPMYILVEIHPVDDSPREDILDALQTHGFELGMVSYDGGQTVTTDAAYDDVRHLNSNTHILAQRA